MIHISRGIPLDSRTQVGFCGSSAQVWQQRMSDLEGASLALRWVEPIRSWKNIGSLCQFPWLLHEQQPPLMGEYEPPQFLRANTRIV